MANEVSIQGRVLAVKNGITTDSTAQNLQLTMAGNTAVKNIQTIGTTTEALVLGDVATPGYLYLKRATAPTGDTVYISLDTPASSGNAFATLDAVSKFAIVPCQQTTIYAKAAATATNIEVLAVSL